MKWYDYIITAYYWTLLLLLLVVLFIPALPIWILTVPFDKKRIVFHYYTSMWGAIYLGMHPFWKKRIYNKKLFPKNEARVMISNHLSMVDILSIFSLYRPFKWVAKVELFNVFILGWVMRMNNYIPVDRRSVSSYRKMIKKGVDTLNNGTSIVVFPEGTRSKEGEQEFLPFKKGPFQIAVQSKAPIQPIVIKGSGKAIPPYGIALKGRHNISLTIMEPVPYEEYSKMSTDEMCEYFREMMMKQYKETDA